MKRHTGLKHLSAGNTLISAVHNLCTGLFHPAAQCLNGSHGHIIVAVDMHDTLSRGSRKRRGTRGTEPAVDLMPYYLHLVATLRETFENATDDGNAVVRGAVVYKDIFQILICLAEKRLGAAGNIRLDAINRNQQ